MPAAEEGAAGDGARRGEADGEEEGVRDGEDAKSLVDRAAPIAVVQKNPKSGNSRLPRRPGSLLGGVCRNRSRRTAPLRRVS